MWRYLVGTAATRTTTTETNVIAIISQPCATFLPNSNFNVSCECLHRCVCVCVCVCVLCVCLLASVCCSCCIVVAFQWRTSPDMLHSSNYTCAFLEATSYGSCTGKNNNNNNIENYWSFSYCYCCYCCNSMWVCTLHTLLYFGFSSNIGSLPASAVLPKATRRMRNIPYYHLYTLHILLYTNSHTYDLYMCECIASLWPQLLRRSKNFACLLTNSWIAIHAMPYAGWRGSSLFWFD